MTVDETTAAIRILGASADLNLALEALAESDLEDWCIVGGAIRDTVWRQLLGESWRETDIDVVYYDRSNTDWEADYEKERRLENTTGLNFSVKNQARMHALNNEKPYQSTVDAMSKFPATVSAIGCKLDSNGGPVLFSVFGLQSLMFPCFEPTPHFRVKKDGYRLFNKYISDRDLLDRWPGAKVLW